MSPATPDDSAAKPTRTQRIEAYFFERLGLDGLRALAAKKHVPIHRTTSFYFLGGMALFLFGVQVATGILLSLYYKPSPDQAFESVRAIMTEIDFGWLIRSIHVLERESADRRALSARSDNVHDAGLSRAAGNHLDYRRAAAGAFSGLRLQRLLAALEPVGVLRHPRGHGDRGSGALAGQGSAASGPRRRRRSPATPWPASTPSTS